MGSSISLCLGLSQVLKIQNLWADCPDRNLGLEQSQDKTARSHGGKWALSNAQRTKFHRGKICSSSRRYQGLKRVNASISIGHQNTIAQGAKNHNMAHQSKRIALIQRKNCRTSHLKQSRGKYKRLTIFWKSRGICYASMKINFQQNRVCLYKRCAKIFQFLI